MGIVFKQSLKNTIIIYLGFLIGGMNQIFFLPNYLKAEYQGILTFLLSYSNLIMPLTAFGIQYTIVKFFSSYNSKEEKDRFLTLALFLPLLIAIPIGFLWDFIHVYIVNQLTEDSLKVEKYTYTIFIVSVSCAYFEVFYSWSKVHFQSVFGNVLKEFWNRAVIFILLIFISFHWITRPEFIYLITGIYVLRTILMMFYAFRLYLPKLTFKFPNNINEIIRYSSYIILAGSASAIILDIDKVMIPGKEAIETAAYYSVAVFIGSFIEAPGRAMAQILQPLTSKSLNDDNNKEVESLYKKSSINLLVLGGLFFLLVNTGVSELFKLMPLGYSGGEMVVLMISSVKLYNMFLGNNGAIITNSKFYRVSMFVGLGLALSVYLLNKLFYFKLDFGTEGLALGTLFSVMFFNTFKLFFVKRKFNMSPFTNKTGKMLLIILVMFGAFYFWDFSTPEFHIKNFAVHPIVNIALKSILIVVLYVFLVVKLSISSQINNLVKRFVK